MPGTDEDPRMNPEAVRTVPAGGDTGRVTLVGVVHDHPASAYRVRAVVEAEDPAAVALELPPVALPLFRQYADDEAVPPRDGGEMSAAIQAAGDRRVAGIDLPRRGSTVALFGTLVDAVDSVRVARRALRAVGATVAHAAECRLAALWGRLRETPRGVDDPVDHDCSPADPPSAQAADEARTMSINSSVLNAFERPHVAAVDEARERSMATALEDLRAEGDVVAVVGFAHLDGVQSRLRD